jgi:hypothetical protein
MSRCEGNSELGIGNNNNLKEEKFMKKVKCIWADNKDDFITGINPGSYFIIDDDELVYGGGCEEMPRNKIKNKIFIEGGSSSYWLRQYCEEHRPEIDFDKEFITNEPGVFARYQERFGYDYEDWTHKEIYRRLRNELNFKGYDFPWENEFGSDLNIKDLFNIVHQYQIETNRNLLAEYDHLYELEIHKAWQDKSYYGKQKDLFHFAKGTFDNFISKALGVSPKWYKGMKKFLSQDNGRDIFKYGISDDPDYISLTNRF